MATLPRSVQKGCRWDSKRASRATLCQICVKDASARSLIPRHALALPAERTLASHKLRARSACGELPLRRAPCGAHPRFPQAARSHPYAARSCFFPPRMLTRTCSLAPAAHPHHRLRQAKSQGTAYEVQDDVVYVDAAIQVAGVEAYHQLQPFDAKRREKDDTQSHLG